MMLFRHHPREIAIVLGLTAGGSLAFYAYTTYMQKFLVNTAGFSKDTAHRDHRPASLLVYMLRPAAGRLAVRPGRAARRTMAFALRRWAPCSPIRS